VDSGWLRLVPGHAIVVGCFRGSATRRRVVDVCVAEGAPGAQVELSIDEAIGDEVTWDTRVHPCPGAGGTRVIVAPDERATLRRVVVGATAPALARVKIEGGGHDSTRRVDRATERISRTSHGESAQARRWESSFVVMLLN
jgi:hypothetical protein